MDCPAELTCRQFNGSPLVAASLPALSTPMTIRQVSWGAATDVDIDHVVALAEA